MEVGGNPSSGPPLPTFFFWTPKFCEFIKIVFGTYISWWKFIYIKKLITKNIYSITSIQPLGANFLLLPLEWRSIRRERLIMSIKINANSHCSLKLVYIHKR